MKIIKLPHAGMIVVHKGKTLLFDPIFSKIIQDTYLITNPVAARTEIIRNMKFDGIFISHFHEDHFCLRSLNHLNRECRFYVPKGDLQMMIGLRKLGFKNIGTMEAGKEISIGELKVVPIHSAVPFPEVAYAVTDGRSWVWNHVDANIRPKEFQKLKTKYGSPDVVFCKYMVEQEGKIRDRSILSSSYQKYFLNNIEVIRKIKPHIAIPSSWDVINFLEPWINEYLAPVKDEEFVKIVEKKIKGVRGRCMKPGGAIIFDKNKIRFSSGLDEFKKFGLSLGRENKAPRMTKPGPVKNHFQTKLSDSQIRKKVLHYLCDEFLMHLNQSLHEGDYQKLIRQKLNWKLTLIFKNNKTESFIIDFAKTPLSWKNAKNSHWDFETQVGAIDLLRFLNGKLVLYPFYSGGLVKTTYRVKKSKVIEPLFKTLGPARAQIKYNRTIDLLTRQ